MLAAFQGFATSHGGKKTRQDVQVISEQLLSSENSLNTERRQSDVFPVCSGRNRLRLQEKPSDLRIMAGIILDEKFQSLLPPLDAETYRMLEESILEHGCLTPLVVWSGVLIDGYNRYRICTEHDIPFTTVSKDFQTRDEALIWMIENQIARRNLTPLQLSRFRGIHYRADRRLYGDISRFTQKSEESQNGARTGSTSTRLSEFYGVSRDTIFRDIKVADAFDVMGAVSPEAVRMVVNNEVSINRGKLETLASGTKEQSKQSQKLS